MPKCIEDECEKRARFNKTPETNAIYCGEHKKQDMIDVVKKKCIYPDCNTIPNFNFQGQTKAIYCNEHKSPAMINIKNKKLAINTNPYLLVNLLPDNISDITKNINDYFTEAFNNFIMINRLHICLDEVNKEILTNFNNKSTVLSKERSQDKQKDKEKDKEKFT